MSSDVEICNLALMPLGAKLISALSPPTTEEARRCLACWEQCWKSLQQEHPWDFVMTRVTLTADPTAPEFEFGYRLLLPGDCLQLDLVYGYEESDWEVEKGYLLLNADEAEIKYRAAVSTTAWWPVAFVDAMVGRLKQRIGPTYLPKADPSVWYQEEQIAIRRAKRLNAIQQSDSKKDDQETRYNASTWATAGR